MACAIIAGYALDCKDTVGGIKNLYITELANVSTVTENASGFVTGITMVATKKFYKYELEPQGANNFVENIQADPANGTVSYEQVITANFVKLKYETQYKLSLIIKNRTAILVETKDGKYFFFGRRNGMEVLGGSANSGQAMNDFNGYSPVFTGIEKDLANEVDASIIAALL